MQQSKVKIHISAEDIVGENSKIEEEFNCPVCQCLIYNPIQCSQCKISFCQHCCQEWQDKQKLNCPVSGCENFKTEKSHPFFYKQLSYLKLKCPNQNCTENIQYELYEKHMELCDFLVIDCKYKDNGCNLQGIQKELLVHIQKCDYQQINCQYCEINMLLKEQENHLQNECEKYTIMCPNYICQEQIFNKNSNLHIKQECKYIKKPCKYCKKLYFQFQLKDHLEICDQKTFQCQYCQQQFKNQEFQDHQRNICDQQEILCEICKTKFTKQQLINHDKQECLIQAFLKQQQQFQQLEITCVNLENQNNVMKAQLKNQQEKDEKQEEKYQHITELQQEIQRIENQILQIFIQEHFDHLEKKHSLKFENFKDTWKYYKYLENTYNLYSGWHAFHCIPCMKFVKHKRQNLQPLSVKRKLLKEQIQQLLQLQE